MGYDATIDNLTVVKRIQLADATTQFLNADGNDIEAQLAVLDTVAAAELELIDGLTAGTVTASKAVTVTSDKDCGDFRNLDCTNLDAGASGTAGTVDVFPATASKGKLIISCENQDGNTTVTLKPAAMGQAAVISIPDPGAATANVVLTDQANDGVVVTASATELNQLDGTTLTAASILANMATTAGAGITAGADNFASCVEKIGTLFKTTIVIDIDGLNSGGTANDIIGKADTASCSLGQITAARNGTLFAGRLTCLQATAGGDDDIDLYSADESTGTEDAAVTALTNPTQLCNSGDLSAGSVIPLTAFPAANQYLYLTAGTGDTNDTYTAGILIIELWGK